MNPPEPFVDPCPPELLAEARQRLIDCLPALELEGQAIGRTSADMRAAPFDAAELQTMVAQYDPAVLLATHCFAPDDADGVTLVSGLTTPGAPVLLLREARDAPPFAVVATGRPPTSPPLAADFVKDFETRRLAEKWGGVMIAATDVTAAALWRRQGLPAMPIADLARFQTGTDSDVWDAFDSMKRVDSKKLRALERQIDELKGINDPDPEDIEERNELERGLALRAALVVPLWDPVTYSPIAALGPESFLPYIQTQAARMTYGVGLWAPSAQTLLELQRAFTAQGAPERRRLLRWSFTNELRHLGFEAHATLPSAHETADLVALRARYLKIASSEPANSQARQQAKQAYLTQVDAGLIAPIVASGTIGPEDAMLAWTEAMLFRRVIGADDDFALEQHGVHRATGYESISMVCSLTDKLLHIHKVRQENRYGHRRHRPAR